MKDAFQIALVAAGLLLACSSGWSAGTAPADNPAPTAKPAEGAPAAAPAAPDPKTLDLKAALAPEQYVRAVEPVLALIERAAKALALHDEEMAKTAKERNEAAALAYNERAARYYLAASLRARLSRNYVSQEAHKAALTEQYEIPMRTKAIALFLKVAASYLDRHDQRAAVAGYQRVLSIDPENAEAKRKMEEIEAAATQSAAQTGGIQSRSGGKEQEKPIDHNADYYRDRYNPDSYSPQSYKDRYSRTDRYGDN